MGEFYKMAEKGRVFLFGNGEYKMNPIHGNDLAEICVNTIQKEDKEISIGGPQILTYNQIAKIAFSVAGKDIRITHIPNWVRKTILFLLRTFTNSKVYGPVEFFMAILSMNMIAPEFGNHTLKEYFETLKAANPPLKK
jgi:nucleoside-diphosphate-sugar epimerase